MEWNVIMRSVVCSLKTVRWLYFFRSFFFYFLFLCCSLCNPSPRVGETGIVTSFFRRQWVQQHVCLFLRCDCISLWCDGGVVVHFSRGFAEVIFVGDRLLAGRASASDSVASILEGNHESRQ